MINKTDYKLILDLIEFKKRYKKLLTNDRECGIISTTDKERGK